MTANKEALRRDLEDVLAFKGITWASLTALAEQVVLFGSRATGEAGESSDWDLLCIGASDTFRSETIDIVWVAPSRLASSAWLGSELASHVARYGIWLHGEDTWSEKAYVGSESVERKVRTLVRSIESLEFRRHELAIRFRRKRALRIRRDIQRLLYLASGEPVPPTPRLDAQWRRDPDLEALVEQAHPLLSLNDSSIAALREVLAESGAGTEASM